MATIPRILTYEEWLRMPVEHDGREEVVNGELIIMPPNRVTHADVVEQLIEAFLPRIDRKEIKILGSSVSLMIQREPLTCRAPDVLVYWRKNIVRDEYDVLCSAPDLLIEVLSPSENKRRKLDDYAKISVPEVWIVSPQAETIEIHTFGQGKLALAKIVAEGNLEPIRFPGVSIPVSEIWPEESE